MPSLVQLPDDLQAYLSHLLPHSIQSEDVIILIHSLSTLQPAQVRAQAFLFLAQLANDPPPVRLLSTPILHALLSTEPSTLIDALSFTAALLQACPAVGHRVIETERLLDQLAHLVDRFPSSLPVLLALTELLSQASNLPPGRKILLEAEYPWLDFLQQRTTSPDDSLRASSAVSLAKLSRGTEENNVDEQTTTASARSNESRDVLLAERMKALLLSTPASNTPSQPTLDALETLAFTSLRPSVKEALANDRSFLRALFQLVPPPAKPRSFNEPLPTAEPVPAGEPSSAVYYGVMSVLANLVAYRPVRSEEESQLHRLRRMTLQKKQAAKEDEGEEETLETDLAVRRRAISVLEAGGVGVLSVVGRVGSVVVRTLVGKIWLGLVMHQGERSLVIQQGGVKGLSSSFLTHGARAWANPVRAALVQLTSTLLPPPSSPLSSLSTPTLDALQALSKILITSSPFSIFHPLSSSLDVIRPLSTLLLHPSSSLLQQFEALMALTNLASVSPLHADRIATFSNGQVLSKLDTLFMETNELIRRAAVELLCNLLTSHHTFTLYSGDDGDASTSTAAAAKLHLLLALTTVDDAPTRSAASGALASLTESPHAVHLLISRPEGPAKSLRTAMELVSPEDGVIDEALIHRGAVLVGNVMRGMSGVEGWEEVVRAEGVRETLVLVRGRVGGEVKVAVGDCLGCVENVLEG